MNNEFNDNPNTGNDMGGQSLNTESNNNVDMTNIQPVDNEQNVQNFNAYQEFNSNPVNNVAPQQPVGDIPQQPVQQPQFEQPMGAQPINEAPIQQPMNNNMYQQPINNIPQQPMGTQPMNQPKANNNKVIIGVIVGIVAALAAGFFVYSLLTKNTASKNNYDDTQVDTVSTTEEASITYQGFTFQKVAGYIYKAESNALLIGNNNVAYALDVLGADYDQMKSNKEELVSELTKKGYTISNCQEKNAGGRSFITMETTTNGKDAIIAISKATTGAIFMTAIAVPTYTIDYSQLDGLAEILDKASYTGNNDSYASTLPTDYNIDGLVENVKF